MLNNWNYTEPEISVLELAGRVRERMAAMGNLSDDAVLEICEEEAAIRGISDLKRYAYTVRQLFCSLRRELEILQDYADDPEVSEIMVNGTDRIFIERLGRIEQLPIRFESKYQLEQIIQRLAARVGREMNDLNPIVDARLSDGSRVNAVNSNIAIGGPILTIRKFGNKKILMEDLIRSGSLSREAADFMIGAVRGGANIFVSGGTSSGKTTFLNVLSDYIPPEERLIVIEDSAELQIRGSENLVRMETKNANAQGKGEVTIRDLIKTSLRMRPDRIIVGEVRGEEAADMLSAMSTGHDGSLSTGHANSPSGMLGRLESMVFSATDIPIEAIRSQIVNAIDLIVQLERKNGRRRLVEICELGAVRDGEIELNPLFIRDGDGNLVRTGNEIIRKSRIGAI